MHLTDFDRARSLANAWMNGSAEILTPKSEAQPLPNAKPVGLDDAWQKFLDQCRARKLSSTSLCKYDLLRRRMLDFAETRALSLLKEFDINILESFQSEWKESDITCLKKLEQLKAFFRAAFLRNWIDGNPTLALRGPKPKPRPTLPFTQDEMKRVLDALELYPDKCRRIGQANAKRLRAFVLVLRFSGMRISDVTSLSVERRVDNKILLYTQKTGVPVYCVLPQFVADLLECLPRLSERYFFWTGNSTMHTAIGCWQRSLGKLFKLAGIRNGHAHRFRDTFSTELLLSGVPIEQVATLLGHSNIKVTQQHYNPWVRDRQRQLEADLQRAWDRDPIVLLNSTVDNVGAAGIKLPN